MSWYNWHTRNTLPRHGGLLDQPLKLLAAMQAYELIYNGYTSGENHNWYDLSKLNATQLELVRWIENEDETDSQQSETNPEASQ